MKNCIYFETLSWGNFVQFVMTLMTTDLVDSIFHRLQKKKTLMLLLFMIALFKILYWLVSNFVDSEINTSHG
jgi:flagellar biogenesis protein FliO